MGNTKEQENTKVASVEKVVSANAQTANESQAVENKSTSEDKVERLNGQISALQRELKELRESKVGSERSIQEFAKTILGQTEMGAKSLEETIAELKSEVTGLKASATKNELEVQKREVIDSLELPEKVKSYLKTKVSVDVGMTGEQIASEIEKEAIAVQELLGDVQKKQTTRDTRPISDGSNSSIDYSNANSVLANLDKIKENIRRARGE